MFDLAQIRKRLRDSTPRPWFPVYEFFRVHGPEGDTLFRAHSPEDFEFLYLSRSWIPEMMKEILRLHSTLQRIREIDDVDTIHALVEDVLDE